MSSKLQSGKKSSNSAGSGRLGLITLIAGVIVVIAAIVIIKSCENTAPDEGKVPRKAQGTYVLSKMASPDDGTTRDAKELIDTYRAAGYTVNRIIWIDLLEDGTFVFESDLDLMVRYEGRYRQEGEVIIMEADGTEMRGTTDGHTLTLTDAEGQVMVFAWDGRQAAD